MTYNESLRLKLRGNIFGVLFFLLIATIMFGIKLYSLYGASPSLLDINSVLLAGDYLVIMFFIWGILSLIASVFLYFKFDSFNPYVQIRLFMAIGLLFLPYTIILVVIGIMKYMEKNKFKGSFFGTSILTLLIFGIFASMTVTELKKIEPIYTSEYTFEAEYLLTTEDFVRVEVIAVTRGDKILSMTINGIINSDMINDPVSSAIPGTTKAGEYYRMSVNDSSSIYGKPTCFNIPNDVVLENYEFSCEVTDFVDPYQNISGRTFQDFGEFYFEYGYMDSNGIWTPEVGTSMRILNQSVIENIYDIVE